MKYEKYNKKNKMKQNFKKVEFPELKWEDEPIEVDLVGVTKSIITDKEGD